MNIPKPTRVNRKAEEKDKLTEEPFPLAAIVKSSHDAIIGITLDGIIVTWNAGAERVYGYSAEYVRSRSIAILTPQNHPDEMPGILKQIKRGEFVAGYETVRARKDDGQITVSLTVSPIKNASGNIVGAASISRDITATVTTQTRASQYARSLIEASLDPLVTISPEGKITDVNEATIKVTGVTRERLIGTDFSSYFTEPGQAEKGYQQVFQKGFVTDYPLTIRRADSRLIDVLYNATVYKDDKGSVLGVFAAARDVTSQKQASQYLHRKPNPSDSLRHARRRDTAPARRRRCFRRSATL